MMCEGASKMSLAVENLPANAGNIRDQDLIFVWGRSPGGGHGNSLHYSCLENPTDRGEAWWAAVHRVAQSQTQLKRLSRHAFYHIHIFVAAKYGRLINRIQYNIQLWKLKGYACPRNGLTF